VIGAIPAEYSISSVRRMAAMAATGSNATTRHVCSNDRFRGQERTTDERKAKARKLARKNRFFERAHLTRRRAPAPFLKAEAIQNLGKHAVGFGKAFERRVRALFDKGLTDAAIARALDVGRATVTYRTMHWRKRKRERRLRSPRSELPSRG
jgi:hypothetical protein